MQLNATPMPEGRLWIFKFFESFFVILAILHTMLMLLPLLFLSEIMVRRARPFIVAEEKLVILALVIALIASAYWSWREKGGYANSPGIHAWLQGMIRYWLALSISIYGFSKILNMQFGGFHHTGDVVINQLTGFQLTWTYFSQSYALGLIIGLCQVVGSMLLLFRRTTLFGVFILVPVMINIVLINYFYSIPKGAFYNSIFYTTALLFLLSLRWNTLKLVLFVPLRNLPPIKLSLLKPVVRLGVIVLAFAITYNYAMKTETGVLDGKWKVEEFIRNGVTIKDDSWVSDASVWKNIYIERQGKLILCPNPYVFESDRSQEATFKFDSVKNQMRAIIQTGWSVTDTMEMRINSRTNKEMQWTAFLKRDTLNLKLTKVFHRH